MLNFYYAEIEISSSINYAGDLQLCVFGLKSWNMASKI